MAPAGPPSPARIPAAWWAALVVLVTAAVGVQAAADGTWTSFQPARSVLWVRSPSLMTRLALGFDALVADLYWIRAVQYYGGTKLSKAEGKNYDLLYPLLDMTTTLDPRFTIAYRFGGILLSEGYPSGPGRPDEAISLLDKGIRQTPDRWEYLLDAGFIEYWWRMDYVAAADWFRRAAKVPGAPAWIAPLVPSVLAEGGARDAARTLWTQMARTTDQEWLRRTAVIRLLQLDAADQVDQLQAIVNRFYDRERRFPSGWDEMVRAGWLRGVPADPSGTPYVLDPVSGTVDASIMSELYPLRRNAAMPPA